MMSFLKKLTGLFVFVAAIAGAVAVSRYFSAPRPPVNAETPPPPAPPRVPADAPRLVSEKSPPPASVRATQVISKARLVTLDFTTKKSHVTLELERDRARPAPERVWTWVFFFSPGDDAGCSGEPVEVRQPFARGDRATVVVEADASRCAPPRSPTATLYAHVNVSAESAEAARRTDSQLGEDISKATPVVVAGARQNN